MPYLTVHETRAEARIAARIAAIGAAYELYLGRLRVLNRLCCSPARDVERAGQVAHARLLVEEAYARWFCSRDPTGPARRPMTRAGPRA